MAKLITWITRTMTRYLSSNARSVTSFSRERPGHRSCPVRWGTIHAGIAVITAQAAAAAACNTPIIDNDRFACESENDIVTPVLVAVASSYCARCKRQFDAHYRRLSKMALEVRAWPVQEVWAGGLVVADKRHAAARLLLMSVGLMEFCCHFLRWLHSTLWLKNQPPIFLAVTRASTVRFSRIIFNTNITQRTDK